MPTTTITNNLRREVYRTIPHSKQWFLSSNQTTNFLKRKTEQYKCDKEIFITLTGDIILGFYRIEDTVPLLQQELGVDPRTAALLGADVLEFLAPLSDPNWQPPINSESEDDSSETAIVDSISTTPIGVNVADTYTEIDEPVVTPNILHTPTKLPIPDPSSPAMTTGVAHPVPAPTTAPAHYTPPVPLSPSPTPHFNYEPVYKSTQDSIRQPLSHTPDYAAPTPPIPPVPHGPIDPPRWSNQ